MTIVLNMVDYEEYGYELDFFELFVDCRYGITKTKQKSKHLNNAIVPAREMGPRELLKSSSPSFGRAGG